MKQTLRNVVWKGKVFDKSFENYKFIDLRTKSLHLKDSFFDKCEFYNCTLGYKFLGFKSSYTNCIFRKVKFYGRYSSMSVYGGKTIYKNCSFSDVEIIGANQFLYALEFHDCNFSGKFINCIFNSLKNDVGFKTGVRFINCNLKETIFQNTSIYSTSIFENCSLPEKNMIYLDNTNNYLIESAEEFIKEEKYKQFKYFTKVLFSKDFFLNQNLIMLDFNLIEGILKTNDEKLFYNKIIEGKVLDVKTLKI